MAKPVIMFVVGTRPDAIKTAPVVQEFSRNAAIRTVLVSTGQHSEMLSQALAAFHLVADEDLKLMRHGQSLASFTSRAIAGIDQMVESYAPAMVYAQGDTTTTFVAGLASFYRKVPFGHIEAGLRTDTVWNPFPEEFNRRAVSLFAAVHFAPTAASARALLDEKIDPKYIFVTGNTGIDAVRQMAGQSGTAWYADHPGRVVLLTTHRRENWGERQEQIARAARTIADMYDDVLVVVPMHKNPAVRDTLRGVLDGHPRIDMIEPPDYSDFVNLLVRSDLILTDSGGVQEEAPTFGKPVLVLRETTERPEGVAAGTAKLVGTREEDIIREASSLLTNEDAYQKMAGSVSPYGDGRAAQRVRYFGLRTIGIDSPTESQWT